MRQSKKLIILIFLILGIGAIWFWSGLKPGGKGQLEVVFFDVGQGDSIFITTPSNQQILIDGGPNSVVLDKLGDYLPFYDHTIDLVILTHPHADHIAGLLSVLERYKVNMVLQSNLETDSILATEWEGIIQSSGVKKIIAQAGQEYRLGEVKVSVLFPRSDQIVTGLDSAANDYSLVTKVSYQSVDFLLMGDAPEKIEQDLLKYQSDSLPAEVLKVGHHGSRYSSSIDFLSLVRPEWAVIQSGQGNSYGHPHQPILNNLKNIGTKILRNDKSGDVKMTSDGNTVSLIN